MSIYTIEINKKDPNADIVDNIIKRLGPKRVVENFLKLYGDVNRTLTEANIECEPNLPWKLSIMRQDLDGSWRILKDVELP